MYLSTEYRIPHVLKLHKNVQASIIWFVLPMSFRILFNTALNISFGSTFALMFAYPRPAPSLTIKLPLPFGTSLFCYT